MTRAGIAGVSVLGALLLASCNTKSVDLGVVQQYAKTTAVADVAFSAIANDLYESCLRYREYAEPASVGGQPLWSKLPTRPPEPTPPPVGSSPTPDNGAQSDADCRVSSDLAYRWDMENRGVLGYVHALGAAAGVDVMPPNFGALGNALNASGAIGRDAVATAAANLIRHIAGSLIAARQRHDLYLIAHAAQQGGLDRLVRDLQRVNVDTYQRNLENERTAVNGFYTTVLENETRDLALLECPTTSDVEVRRELSCARYPSPRQRLSLATRIRAEGQAAQLRDRIRRQRSGRQRALNEIDARENAARSYSKAIGDIANGNDAILTQPPNDLSGLMQAVQPYVSGLRDKISALVTALEK